jgi:hypothetical protein
MPYQPLGNEDNVATASETSVPEVCGRDMELGNLAWRGASGSLYIDLCHMELCCPSPRPPCMLADRGIRRK